MLGSTIGTTFSYKVDTEGGNSGSAVVNEATQEIIGIHNAGGCSGDAGMNGNRGTKIAGNAALTQAIRQCMAMDQ